ncbi:MAG: polysulfide reductase NrfD [Magnetococcales bacterium]|nr:polysulfide reductase NrfD [Magnetococcales bacterium]
MSDPSPPDPFLPTLCRHALAGPPLYHAWIALLLAGVFFGGLAYGEQAGLGLQVTGLSDQVVWGLYIGNFTFLVGVAAAAVVLVIPAALLHHPEAAKALLPAKALAIAAVVMSLLFVLVDLGRPARIWHALPGWGTPNFPLSILAWDMLVLGLYLALSLFLFFFVLRRHHRRLPPHPPGLFPAILLAILLGIGIHTVTAFMLAANPARPFWHSSLLAPRFIASAFAAGSGILLLTLRLLDRFDHASRFQETEAFLRRVMAITLSIHLFFLASELFVHLHRHTGPGRGTMLLLHGGAGYLSDWVWTGMALNGVRAVLLLVTPWRRHRGISGMAAVAVVVGVWLEKGPGLIVPGFIPTPLGEMAGYDPTAIEIRVSLGIVAAGLLILTLLLRVTSRMAAASDTGGNRRHRPAPDNAG